MADGGSGSSSRTICTTSSGAVAAQRGPRVSNGRGQSAKYVGSVGRQQRLAAKVAGQCSASTVLHHDEGHAFAYTRALSQDNVRMSQSHQRADFAAKARDTLRMV